MLLPMNVNRKVNPSNDLSVGFSLSLMLSPSLSSLVAVGVFSIDEFAETGTLMDLLERQDWQVES